jgi:hypothetical protein
MGFGRGEVIHPEKSVLPAKVRESVK